MHIDIGGSFKLLEEAALRLRSSEPVRPIDLSLPPMRIDRENHGVEPEVERDEFSGTFYIDDEPVLVYIPDHSLQWYDEDSVRQGKMGNKVHFTWCTTLEDKRKEDVPRRYVVTNEDSGRFRVTVGSVPMRAPLKVCRNCLKENPPGYRADEPRTHVVDTMNWKHLLRTYRPRFKELPSCRAGRPRDDYLPNWRELSTRYRARRGWKCERETCHVVLRNHHHLLDLHHANHVKQDNMPTNLIALCKLCHADQPGHGHMKVSDEDRATIERLRREQGPPAGAADDVIYDAMML